MSGEARRLTKEERDAIRTGIDDVAPGPWEHVTEEMMRYRYPGVYAADCPSHGYVCTKTLDKSILYSKPPRRKEVTIVMYTGTDDFEYLTPSSRKTYEFIATSRTLVPQLLDDIDAADVTIAEQAKEIERLRALIRDWAIAKDATLRPCPRCDGGVEYEPCYCGDNIIELAKCEGALLTEGRGHA